ncbi:catabolic L-serine/threonine dehydratase [[Candida] railenensis]|uniref:L-serine ammonia-lyase n=1 Tax=[Candida] railenensis TaxID=45579 RepID=A0A9P0QLR3_9ASCO|nr:catabolic L-serine/threonine dehydratase [[Candida] railenensis]
METIEQVQPSSFSQPFTKTTLTEVTDSLPRRPPCRVFFKNEYEQPSGSFKLRGIGNLIGRSIAKAESQGISKNSMLVLASSGGNAGLAAAYASEFYNVSCIVVLPTSAKAQISAKLKQYGAKTVIIGSNINEADTYLKNVLMAEYQDKHIIYCHPFDNPLIWEGHASLITELSTQLDANEFNKLRSVVCSVGGGGLYNGLFKGLQQCKTKNTDLLLIETNQAPTMKETIRRGEIFTLDSVSSIATSLACSYLSPKSLDNFQNDSNIHTYLESIDDLESIKPLVQFYNQTGVVVEPACGAALSVVYDQLHLLEKNLTGLSKDDIVVIVVCGGSCTTLEELNSFKTVIARQENKL